MMLKRIILVLAFLGLYFTLVSCQTTIIREEGLGIGEPVLAKIPGERIEIKSISPISAKQVLEKRGREDTITGYLTIPENFKGKAPAVIIKHCGAGVKDSKDIKYAQALNKWGYATFVVDSWELRKLEGLSLETSGKDKVISLVDIYNALKVLGRDPRIDPNRIAVLGWANAADAVLASQISKVKQVYDSGVNFAAAIAIQPINSEAWWISKNVEKTPTLILCGERDVFAPCDRCFDYKKLMDKAGGNINIISYPSAGHNWDLHFTPRKTDMFFDTSNCYALFNVDTNSNELNGQIVSDKEITNYFYSCIVSGAWAGWDGPTASKALEDVRVFLEKHLR